MIEANVASDYKHIVAQKAFETATKLDGLVPITLDNVTKTRVEHFEGKLPGFVTHVKKWGMAGTVKIKNINTPKLGDRGITCMFVGYATNHSGDCYEMLNMSTRRVIQTRDVIWLGRMYFDKERPDELKVTLDDNDVVDINTEQNVENTTETIPEPPNNDSTIRTRSGRRIKAPSLVRDDINNGNEVNGVCVQNATNKTFMHVNLSNDAMQLMRF